MSHTFFINASFAEFDRYQVLAEMEIEKRQLLTLDILDSENPSENSSGKSYPIKNWCDVTDGRRNYEYCADKIREIIDSDKNVSDNFNLVIYIDLCEFEEYKNIPELEEYEHLTAEEKPSPYRQKLNCREAFRRILRSFVRHTMVYELEQRSCAPVSTLLILDTGCEPISAENKDQNLIRRYECELLGLNKAFFKAYRDTSIAEGTVSADAFERLFFGKEKNKPSANQAWKEDSDQNFWNGVKEIFGKPVKTWCKDGIKTQENASDEKTETVFGRDDFMITKGLAFMNQKCGESVKTILFEKNRFAIRQSMHAFAEAQITLYIYLLQCSERGFLNTGSKKSEDQDADVNVFAFNHIDIEKTEEILFRKYKMYEAEAGKISPDGTCSKMKEEFQKQIQYLPFKGYGLDKYGKWDKKLSDSVEILKGMEFSEDMNTYLNQSKEDVKAYKPKTETEEDPEAAFAEEENRESKIKEITDQLKKAKEAATNPGETEGEKTPQKFKNVKDMLAEAKIIKESHEKLHDILQTSVKDWLPNYTADAPEKQQQAKLPKRNPNEQTKRYLIASETDGETENAKTNTEKTDVDLRTFAKQAYDTVKERYLEGNRVYPVSATNIDKQYKWFTNRVKEIREGIRRLTFSALIACLVLLCSYIPFFLIQKNLIFENLVTAGIAMVTFAVPFAILFVVFGILKKQQESEYEKAFAIFMEEANKSVAENEASLQNYLDLLKNRIPSLRYIYEYKTDVECAFKYYEIDRGKCQHHRIRLLRRKETVGNILEDLDVNLRDMEEQYRRDHSENSGNKKEAETLGIDYTKAFSSGKENQKIYSILTKEDIHDITNNNTNQDTNNAEGGITL
ncbi:MAG: hypothetical protein IJA86_00900 [Clostridia bacterium]|nr:hypothetical protein [Clostridia bacterium]